MTTTTITGEAPAGGYRNLTADFAKLRGDFLLFAVDRCAVCGGPLFENEHDDEKHGDSKKKSKKKDKKEKKSKKDEGEQEDRDDGKKKKKLKKSKSVMRFLSKGKSKATNLLDDLQYEGDELERKKAKRRQSQDHGCADGSEGDENDNDEKESDARRKSRAGRVSSEPRLQDRRGRVPPTRSRTMSVMPTSSTSALKRSTSARNQTQARIICRPCERGEKRRSWTDDYNSSLEESASLTRLFQELSEEKELIISLMTRYDYLVSSVSDVGDLFIELFTPQLKDENESEPLTPDESNGPKRNSASNAKSTSSLPGEWQGLSLGKLFGWNDKSANRGSNSSGGYSSDETTNGAKSNQRKVMALLPSCYCTSKKADKYESFFPEFHYDVYRAAEGLEKELSMTTETYKAALKLFARLKSTIQTGRQERLIANMKISFVEFIQEKQPEFNWLKLKRKNLVVCQASFLFLVMCQLLWEIRKKQSLWMKVSKHFLATIQVMQSELASLAISSHKEWNEHKTRIEEIITEYNKLKAEKNKAINATPENTKMNDGELILNCERIVRECVKQVEFNLGETCMRATKESLVELVANLVLERAKA